MNRSALLEWLADRISGVVRPHPVRVAIDGVDGVGKTTLADELVASFERRDGHVIRASIDGFHNPRSVRYRRGKDSPAGYFRDSFNYAALTDDLLRPLGPDGSRRYRRAVFDYRTDTPVEVPSELAPPNAILLFDGVFLQCAALRMHWDLSIFLHAPFEATIGRCAVRDGGSPDVDAASNRRYVEGQRLYMQECDPMRVSTIVIDNEDVTSPRVVPRLETDVLNGQ